LYATSRHAFSFLLGNNIFESTIPLSVTIIMSQFGGLTLGAILH